MSDSRPNSNDSRWPFRLAVALVCVTFPLIWVGGLVTTYDAGMAVPDWPGTYGYNLLLYPWTTWIAGPFDLFIEHGHRLLGALAGMVTIALVAVTWRSDVRPAARYGALAALVLVVAQGGLGGLRVKLDARTFAMIHGCVGPAFLAYVVGLAVYLSRGWKTAGEASLASQRTLRLALMTTIFAYLQLVLGAQIRHMPPDASAGAFRMAVLFHLLMALVVVAHSIVLAWHVRSRNEAAWIRLPASLLLLVVGCQVILGSATWIVKYGWPFGLSERVGFAATTVVANSLPQAMTVTAHVATGSIILALGVLVTARAFRLSRAAGPLTALSFAMVWEVSR